MVSSTFTLEGTAADFTDAKQTLLKAALAARYPGVEAGDVTLTVPSSGSDVAIKIIVPNATIAEEVVSDLQLPALRNELSASAGVAIEAIQSQGYDIQGFDAPSPPPPLSPSSDVTTVVIVIVAITVVVCLLVVGVLVAKRMRRDQTTNRAPVAPVRELPRQSNVRTPHRPPVAPNRRELPRQSNVRTPHRAPVAPNRRELPRPSNVRTHQRSYVQGVGSQGRRVISRI